MEPRHLRELVVGGPSGLPQMRKHKKTTALVDAHGKRPLEEDREDEKEDDYMEEDSPPQRGTYVEEEDENFLHYVLLRRANTPRVELPKKANTTLVALEILDNVPLLLDIMPKLAKMKFK